MSYNLFFKIVLFILLFRNQSYEEQIQQTCNEMMTFCQLSRRERIEVCNIYL